MSRHAVVVAVVIALASSAAGAETIYRCGSNYSDVACPRGAALDGGAAPTEQQRAGARQVVIAEQRLTAEMTSDRRERVAALHPAAAGSLGPARPSAAAAPTKAKAGHVKLLGKGASPEDDGDFIAAVPKTKKTGS